MNSTVPERNPIMRSLGYGRAKVASSGIVKTIVETVSIGVAAALAGVGIGLLIEKIFGG
jgi:vacuolar iron transporter family protein